MPDVDSATEADEDAPRKLSTHLQDTFEPSGVAVAPDGGPVLPPASELVVLRDADWICLRGPCRNYHRLVKTFDAQKPLDGSTTYADGTPISGAEETVHTCYPAPGREMDIGDVQILDCNRWDPMDPASDEAQALERRRAAYRVRAELEQARDRVDAAATFLALLSHVVEQNPECGTFEISEAAFELLMVTGTYTQIASIPTVAADHLCATIDGRKICINAERSLVDDEIRAPSAEAALTPAHDRSALSPEVKEAIAGAPGGTVDIVHDGEAWKLAKPETSVTAGGGANRPQAIRIDPTRKR